MGVLEVRRHIPRSHPRYESIMLREKLVEAFEKSIVVPQGLIAHGRGEAFDYILGEKSHDFALEAERATVAHLIISEKPIISVNGNYAALAAEEIVRLSIETGAPIEVNLFYRSEDRVFKIEKLLEDHGAPSVLGTKCEKTLIPGLESPRGIVCREGIYMADFILLAIEDGDRTQALKNMGKKIAAIDLNPFSRTAQTADITIVDEALRATRNMVNMAKELKGNNETLKQIILKYDNKTIISKAFKTIMERLREAAMKGILIEF